MTTITTTGAGVPVTRTVRTFEQWAHEVDQLIRAKAGLAREELPDMDYRDWYDQKMAPVTAAKRAIRYARAG